MEIEARVYDNMMRGCNNNKWKQSIIMWRNSPEGHQTKNIVYLRNVASHIERNGKVFEDCGDSQTSFASDGSDEPPYWVLYFKPSKKQIKDNDFCYGGRIFLKRKEEEEAEKSSS